jgi:hypothetical protein
MTVVTVFGVIQVASPPHLEPRAVARQEPADDAGHTFDMNAGLAASAP